jgi:hypothetical protein
VTDQDVLALEADDPVRTAVLRRPDQLDGRLGLRERARR